MTVRPIRFRLANIRSESKNCPKCKKKFFRGETLNWLFPYGWVHPQTLDGRCIIDPYD